MLGTFLWPLTWLLEALERPLGAGGAIVALTVAVRLALLPLARRQARGMWMLRSLGGVVGQLIDRFPDPDEQRERLVALYARHRVSPFGPIGLLIPQGIVFLALYHVIATEALGRQGAFGGLVWQLSEPVWAQPGAWALLIVAAALFDAAILISGRRAGIDAFSWLARATLILVPAGMLASAYYLPAGLAVYLVASAAVGLAQAIWFARMTREPAPIAEISDLLEPAPAS